MNVPDKSQAVRLMDIFLLGPFMIWFGLSASGVSDMARLLLVMSGAGTVLYNGRNYLMEAR